MYGCWRNGAAVLRFIDYIPARTPTAPQQPRLRCCALTCGYFTRFMALTSQTVFWFVVIVVAGRGLPSPCFINAQRSPPRFCLPLPMGAPSKTAIAGFYAVCLLFWRPCCVYHWWRLCNAVGWNTCCAQFVFLAFCARVRNVSAMLFIMPVAMPSCSVSNLLAIHARPA